MQRSQGLPRQTAALKGQGTGCRVRSRGCESALIARNAGKNAPTDVGGYDRWFRRRGQAGLARFAQENQPRVRGGGGHAGQSRRQNVWRQAPAWGRMAATARDQFGVARNLPADAVRWRRVVGAKGPRGRISLFCTSSRFPSKPVDLPTKTAFSGPEFQGKTDGLQ